MNSKNALQVNPLRRASAMVPNLLPTLARIALFAAIGSPHLVASAQCIVPVEGQTLIASDPSVNDRFGYSVAIYGNTMVIGDPFDDAAGSDQGAVYVFTRSGNSWVQQAKILASNSPFASGDRFGFKVAILNNTIAVGAPNINFGRGAVYIFDRSGSTWTQTIRLVSSDDTLGDEFGKAIAFTNLNSRTGLLVGAPGDDNTGPAGTSGGLNAGAVYVFTLNITAGAIWTEVEKIMATDGSAQSQFGASVAPQGFFTLIGSPGNTNANGANAGAVYSFSANLSGSTWTQSAKILADPNTAGDSFGSDVEYQSGTAAIGAIDFSLGSASLGAVYIYTSSGGIWTQRARFNGSPNSRYSDAIALSGDTMVVGSPLLQGNTMLYRRIAGAWEFSSLLPTSNDSPGDFGGEALALGDGFVAVAAPREDAPIGINNNAGAVWLIDLVPTQPVEITQQPSAVSTCLGGTAELSVVATGGPVVSYRWRKNSVDINTASNPSAATSTLTLANVSAADAASYSCYITNPCGSEVSDPANLNICPADFNCDAALDFFDYLDFVQAFSSQLPAADYNADFIVDFFDYLDFVQAFSTGC